MPAAIKTLYTARSQFWLGDRLFKPIKMGGRPVEEGDPILRTHKAMFEPYTPKVRDYPGRTEEKRG